MEVLEQVKLAPYTTLGIGGPARYFATAATEDDVRQAFAWAAERDLPVFPLGGGSNLLVSDQGFGGLVLRMGLMGVEDRGDGVLEVGAGESWDGLVDYAVEHGLAGMECLAGIPGSVGGTPVQNVGAYGQEVSETVENVRVFDVFAQTFTDLSKEMCAFRYRETIFNREEAGRYAVTRVRFRLRPGGRAELRYAELQKAFAGSEPSLPEVAAKVRAIRRGKGMVLDEGEPDSRSAGSFFKNPIVPEGLVRRVAAAAEVPEAEVPHWPAGPGQIKLPAAWLLERAGFHKGLRDGAVGLSSRHTLALINRGGATCADVLRLQERIVAGVAERFGVRLEREPVLVG